MSATSHIKVSDLTTPPKVGQEYIVPTLHIPDEYYIFNGVLCNYGPLSIPVMLPGHEDSDIGGDTEKHLAQIGNL